MNRSRSPYGSRRDLVAEVKSSSTSRGRSWARHSAMTSSPALSRYYICAALLMLELPIALGESP